MSLWGQTNLAIYTINSFSCILKIDQINICTVVTWVKYTKYISKKQVKGIKIKWADLMHLGHSLALSLALSSLLAPSCRWSSLAVWRESSLVSGARGGPLERRNALKLSCRLPFTCWGTSVPRPDMDMWPLLLLFVQLCFCSGYEGKQQLTASHSSPGRF